MPLKNAGLAAVLALIIPGVGHIYDGKIGEGLMWLILTFICGFLVIILIGFILLPIVWIYQIYDAYKTANEYNTAVQQTGRAPW